MTSSQTLNAAYASYIADPAAHSESFWTVLRDYIEHCCYRVPVVLKSDLVQDVVIEIMTHLDRFKLGTDFQKWVSAIIRNMRADCFTDNFYSTREVPVSQLGHWTDDGDYVEFEAAVVDAAETVEVFPDEHDAQVRAALAALRCELDGIDAQIFDLLRTGLNLAQAAMRLGISHDTARQRFSRMKKRLFKSVTLADLAEIETTEAKVA